MFSFSLLMDPPYVDMLVGPPSASEVIALTLREGWNVQNVTVVVDLRPYTAKANILPEQTIGRGIACRIPTLQRVPPGYRFPYGQTHRRQEEVYVVVHGSGRMKLDDEIVEFKQWDAVRVPPVGEATRPGRTRRGSARRRRGPARLVG
jgi:mannose-6-phosphate isomerase-like protein (cupin superfamily)